MAENAFQVAVSGQEVQLNDINQLGATSGLADDHVFAEILRLVPYAGTVAKAIMPGGRAGAPAATVIPSGNADGGILVQPFRAVVGSRNSVNASPIGITTDSDALANWRDIRSGVFVGGTTALNQEIFLAANSSGNPRWDLVYATIQPDANGPNVNRRVKDPTNGNIVVDVIPDYTYTPVTVAVIQGTPGATPALPAIPGDGSGQYNIPLAYVRVPNGFSSSTTVVTRDIRSTTKNGVSDFVHIRGGFSARPCNGNNDENAVFNPSGAFAWNAASANTRPGPWLPPDWRGGDVLFAEIDNFNGSSANWSHQSMGIVDSSRDWRNRVVKVTMQNGVAVFGNDPANTGSGVQSTPYGGAAGAAFVSMGNSFAGDADVVAGCSTLWQSAGVAALLVQQSTGYLIWYVTGTPTMRWFFWIESSAQFSNA